MTDESKPRRGFAAMSKEQHAEIARIGGKASAKKNAGYRFTSETGREAGIKGGQKVSEDREHMAKIGKAGGLAYAENMKIKREQDEKLDD